jgi:hypothetical protein
VQATCFRSVSNIAAALEQRLQQIQSQLKGSLLDVDGTATNAGSGKDNSSGSGHSNHLFPGDVDQHAQLQGLVANFNFSNIEPQGTCFVGVECAGMKCALQSYAEHTMCSASTA